MEQAQYIQYKTLDMLEPTTLKLITSGIVSTGIFFFGHLYTEAIIAIAMLMVMDTVLGMAAAWKEGQDISSKRFSRAVLKGIVYFTAISAGYFADLTIPFDVIQATMVAFVGVTEFISILENIGRLGYQTPKKLLNQLKEYRDNK